METLRDRLLERQSDPELCRKAGKALRLKGKIWTKEEIAWVKRQGERWATYFNEYAGGNDSTMKSVSLACVAGRRIKIQGGR